MSEMSRQAGEKARIGATRKRGPADEYVRRTTTARQYDEHHPWEPLEAALVTTLIDWKCESEMRPSFGEGSDCSDLMDVALTRIKGLCSGVLDPDLVIAEIHGTEHHTPPSPTGDPS